MGWTLEQLGWLMLVIILVPGLRRIMGAVAKGVFMAIMFGVAALVERRARREENEAWQAANARNRHAWTEVPPDGAQDEELRRQYENLEEQTEAERLVQSLQQSDEWVTLAVDSEAEFKEKVQARRRLTLRFHPDKFPRGDAALQAAANECQQMINREWENVEAARRGNEQDTQSGTHR